MSRRWFPGVPDVVFGLVLLSVLVGGRFRLLNDPGTLWHLRLGRDSRDGFGPAGRHDDLDAAGEPWVDQSWLFDVGLALSGRPRRLVGRGGRVRGDDRLGS